MKPEQRRERYLKWIREESKRRVQEGRKSIREIIQDAIAGVKEEGRGYNLGRVKEKLREMGYIFTEGEVTAVMLEERNREGEQER